MFGLVVLTALVAMIAGVTVYPAGPGRAIYIGSNESLYVPDFAMPADAVTIEMWTRPLQPPPSRPFDHSCWWSYAVQHYNYTLGNHLALSPSTVWQNGARQALPTNVATTVYNGHWHHIALTWSTLSRAVNFYINGNLLATYNVSKEGGTLQPGGILHFGRCTDAAFDPFSDSSFASFSHPHGYMDTIRIWSNEMSAVEVGVLMFAPQSSAILRSLSPKLLASFTLDVPDVLSTLGSETSNSTIVRIRNVTSTQGVVAYGGCKLCTSRSNLARIASSDAPNLSANTSRTLKVSKPISRVLALLSFVAEAETCAPTDIESWAVTVFVAQLPAAGTLWDLDNTTALRVGDSLKLYNGSRLVTLPGNRGCLWMGTALAIYNTPDFPSASVLVDSLSYSVRYNTSTGLQTSGTATVEIFRQDLPSRHNCSLVRLTAGDWAEVDLGFSDRAEPFSVIVTKLPKWGRIWLDSSQFMYRRRTQLTDPLGRLLYEAGNNMVDNAVDNVTILYSTTLQPGEPLYWFSHVRNGSSLAISSMRRLMDPSWSAFAFDCGGRHSTLSPGCQSFNSFVAEPVSVSITVSPGDIRPASLGSQLLFTQSSGFDVKVVVPSGAQPPEAGVRYVSVMWAKPSESFVSGRTVNLQSMYGLCPDGLGNLVECEKLSMWFKLFTAPGSPGSSPVTTVTLGLSLRCGLSNGTVVNRTSTVTVPPSMGLGLLAIRGFMTWDARMTHVTAGNRNVTVLTNGFPGGCVAYDSAEEVLGFRRIVWGSRINPNATTILSDYSEAPLYIDNMIGSVDEIQVYQYRTPEQLSAIMLQTANEPLDVLGCGPLAPPNSPSRLLVSAFTFDNVADIYWQPPCLEASSTWEAPFRLIGNRQSFSLLPQTVSSMFPTMNAFSCFENGSVAIPLQATSTTENGYFSVITKFPLYGTLYDVDEFNQPTTALNRQSLSAASGAYLEQWTARLVAISGYHGHDAKTLDGASRLISGPPRCEPGDVSCVDVFGINRGKIGLQSLEVQVNTSVFVEEITLYMVSGLSTVQYFDVWNDKSETWMHLSRTRFTAQTSSVNKESVTLSSCSATFPSNRIRLWFNTSTIREPVLLDAVNVKGRTELYSGHVSNAKQRVVYVPNPSVYGTDTFEYAVTDCPADRSRLSTSSTITVTIQNIDSPPVVATTVLGVKDVGTTAVRISVHDKDYVTSVGGAPLPTGDTYILTLYSLPWTGNFSITQANGSEWLLKRSELPIQLSSSTRGFDFNFTATTDVWLRPQLCSSVDAIVVSVVGRNATGYTPSFAAAISISVNCTQLVCGPGQQAAESDFHGSVCVACPENSYNLSPDSNCHQCPSGGVCPGGVGLYAQRGFWYYDEAFYQCDDRKCCPEARCNVTSADSRTILSTCRQGRTGLLCSVCVDGSKFPRTDGSCTSCTRLGLIPMALILGSFFVNSASNFPFQVITFVAPALTAIAVRVLLVNDYSNIKSFFKQYVDFFQLFGLVVMGSSESASPSRAVEGVGVIGLAWMDVTEAFQKFNIPCLLPFQALGRHVFMAYFVPSAMVVIMLVFLLAAYTKSRIRGELFDGSQFYQAMWQIILLCYTTVTVTGFNLIKCKAVAHWDVLVVDESVECIGSYYTVVSMFGVVASIVAAALLPMYIIFAHKRQHLAKWLSTSDFDPELMAKILDDSPVNGRRRESAQPVNDEKRRGLSVSGGPPAMVRLMTNASAEESVASDDQSASGSEHMLKLDSHPSMRDSRSITNSFTDMDAVMSPLRRRLPSIEEDDDMDSDRDSTSTAGPAPVAPLPHAVLLPPALTRQSSSSTTNGTRITASSGTKHRTASKSRLDQRVVFQKPSVNLAEPNATVLQSSTGQMIVRVTSNRAIRRPSEPTERSFRMHSHREVASTADSVQPSDGNPEGAKYLQNPDGTLVSQDSESADSHQDFVPEVSYVDGVAIVSMVPVRRQGCSGSAETAERTRSQPASLTVKRRKSARENWMKASTSVGLFSRLKWFKSRSSRQSEHASVARASLADVVVQRTRMYKDHLRWWYEAYFLGRRAVFVAVSVALARLPVIRSQLIFLLSIAVLLQQCYQQPYRVPAANMREMALLFVLVGASGFEMLRAVTTVDDSTALQIPDTIIAAAFVMCALWFSAQTCRLAILRFQELAIWKGKDKQGSEVSKIVPMDDGSVAMTPRSKQ